MRSRPKDQRGTERQRGAGRAGYTSPAGTRPPIFPALVTYQPAAATSRDGARPWTCSEESLPRGRGAKGTQPCKDSSAQRDNQGRPPGTANLSHINHVGHQAPRTLPRGHTLLPGRTE